MKIDVFNHVYPREYLHLVGSLTRVSDLVRQSPQLADLDVRFKAMEKYGVEVKVLSLVTSTIDDIHLYYENSEGDEHSQRRDRLPAEEVERTFQGGEHDHPVRGWLGRRRGQEVREGPRTVGCAGPLQRRW